MNIGFDKKLSREALNLAYPVILGMTSQTILGIVDTAMVGRLGAEALAATGFGSAIFLGFTNFFGALGVGTQALTARRYGQDDESGCGRVLFNALFIALLVSIPFSAAAFAASSLVFPFVSEDAAVAEYGVAYLEYRFLGMLFVLLNVALSRFFNGIGNTMIFMKAAIIINGLNIVLDYVLIFGNLGFPRLEVKGAAIASTLATIVGTGYYLSVSMGRGYYRRYKYFRSRNLDRPNLWSITKISFPPGVQSLLTTAGFFAFLWIIGRIDTTDVAAAVIVVKVTSFAFTTAIGFGIAAATLIGQYMGAAEFDTAEKSVWESAKLGAFFLGVFGLIFMILPVPLIKIFTNHQDIIDVAGLPLRIVGFIQVFDAYRIVLEHALQAAGNPQWVMFSEIAVNWFVLIPLTYILAIKLDYGACGAWVSLDVFIVMLAAAMIWKFRQSRWRAISI
ncbi:MAG: MATE family efflux transporter [Thermodesulfobacteriota bacterium]|nr:MATE family efflux transporter [Thermodesulfobacteriota bacterium]